MIINYRSIDLLSSIMPNCKVCNRVATSKCSRCNYVEYCGRDCQTMDWRQSHRSQCAVFDDVANRVYVKLLGNIMIMGNEHKNDIMVTIDEPVHCFLLGDMHLANLELGTANSECEFNVIMNIGGNVKKLVCGRNIDIKKYNPPGPIWSVLFEL